jgi:hypothetical protein
VSKHGCATMWRTEKVEEVVPVFVEFEVAVPHLRPAWW